MEYIPDIILLEIFKNLSFVDLCKCSQVCRRWYMLTKSISLRKKIKIVKYLDRKQFSRLVQCHFHKQLEEFEYLNDNPSSFLAPVRKQTFYKLKGKCPELKKLVLMYCSLANVTLEDMPSTLRHLSVRNSEINPYQLFTLGPHQYVPHLTCLDVGGISNFLTSEDLRIFTNLKSLRCLYLEGCFRINDGGIESIKNIISHLEVLDVEGTDISNESIEIILSHGSMLKELYLGHVRIDDDVFHDANIAKFLRLKILCLRFTDITDMTLNKFDEFHDKKVNILRSQGNGFPMSFKKFIETCTLDHFSGCYHFKTHTCPS